MLVTLHQTLGMVPRSDPYAANNHTAILILFSFIIRSKGKTENIKTITTNDIQSVTERRSAQGEQ